MNDTRTTQQVRAERLQSGAEYAWRTRAMDGRIGQHRPSNPYANVISVDPRDPLWRAYYAEEWA